MRPVAVYGTLRDGCHNAWLWDGLAHAEPGTLHGFRLVGAGHGFPFAIPAEDASVAAVDLIMWNDRAAEAAGLKLMDRLEGAPRFYRRILARVTDRWGDECLAWLYVPAAVERYEHLTPVPHNDWMAAERRVRP